MFIEKLGARPGASPLFTHYDEASGSRVELSGTTFTNWVDKTVNMLDGLGVEAGEPVHLDLVNTSPGHWMTAVWVAAIWQRGCPVAARNDGEAVFTVVGPASDTRGLVTVMCSLHPLGLGLPDLPTDCTDYADVLAESDVHWAESVSPDAPAWLPDITRADLERFPGSAAPVHGSTSGLGERANATGLPGAGGWLNGRGDWRLTRSYFPDR